MKLSHGRDSKENVYRGDIDTWLSHTSKMRQWVNLTKILSQGWFPMWIRVYWRENVWKLRRLNFWRLCKRVCHCSGYRGDVCLLGPPRLPHLKYCEECCELKLSGHSLVTDTDLYSPHFTFCLDTISYTHLWYMSRVVLCFWLEGGLRSLADL